MNPRWKTPALALVIFISGVVLGSLGVLAWQDHARSLRDDPARWSDRLTTQLIHDLRLRPEQRPALATPVAAAISSLIEARIADERNTDAILHRLTEALTPSLDAAQRQEFDRRLAERTRRWSQRLGVSASRNP